MDSVTQFCVGTLFLVILGLGGLCAYLARLLAVANEHLVQANETRILADKAPTAEALAAALNQRDQLRADIKVIQKELQNSIPLASSVPSGRIDDDTLEIGGLSLSPLRR